MSLLSQDVTSKDLELFVDIKSPNEIHFSTSVLSISEFAGLFSNQLQDLTFVLSRFDTKILNDGYWESVTEDDKEKLRAEQGGIITNKLGKVFRLDYCPKGRLIKDGLNLNSQIISGNLLKVDYNGFQKIVELYKSSTEQLEWLVSSNQDDDFEGAFSSFSFTSASQKIIYSTVDNETVKMIFANRDDAESLLEYSIRRLVIGITSQHVSYINKNTVEAMLNVTDKLGFVIQPLRDFQDKDRTYELALHMGKTRWGVREELLHGDEQVLVYYDRTSGIWAMVV